MAGLVARLGQTPLIIAGGHITGCFFDELDRAVRARTRPARSSRQHLAVATA